MWRTLEDAVILNEEQDSEECSSTETSKKVKNTTNDPVGEGDTGDSV